MVIWFRYAQIQNKIFTLCLLPACLLQEPAGGGGGGGGGGVLQEPAAKLRIPGVPDRSRVVVPYHVSVVRDL